MTSQVIPLAGMPRGSRCVIVGINAGRGLMSRLLQMGLTPGTEVVVVENTQGPVLVNVRGVTIALGRGIAEKIMVKPLP